MPKPTPTEVEDAMTFFRMSLPVKEVQYLASQGSFTPISGDALRAYR